MQKEKDNGDLLEIPHDSQIEKACISKNGDYRFINRDGAEIRGRFPENYFNYIDVYNSGVPVSADGKLLLLLNWEKGLFAFNSADGSEAWRFKKTKFKRVIPYPEYVLVLRQYCGIYQLDLSSGKELQFLSGPSAHNFWKLNSTEILVDSLKGRLCILEADTLQVVESFSSRQFNPTSCLSHVIRDAKLDGEKLIISGFREHPNMRKTEGSLEDFVTVLERRAADKD